MSGLVKIGLAVARPRADSPLTSFHALTIIVARSRTVRQFFYGLVLGAASMYLYERLDAPAILAYLNSATESAVESTSGYGGTHHRK